MKKKIVVQKYQKYSSRIVLPVEMCKQLNIKAGTRIMTELDEKNKRIIITKD